MELRNKQERFCLEYVKDFNVFAAMVRAGYSEKYAKGRGYEMLENVGIQNRIQSLQASQVQRLEIEADDLTRFFQSIMNDKKSRDTDRIKAAENLGKRIGYYEQHNQQKRPSFVINETIYDGGNETDNDNPHPEASPGA